MRTSRVKWIQQLDGSLQVLHLERTDQVADSRLDQWQFLDWKDVKQTTKDQYPILEFFPKEFEQVSEIRRQVTLIQSFDCPLS